MRLSVTVFMILSAASALVDRLATLLGREDDLHVASAVEEKPSLDFAGADPVVDHCRYDAALQFDVRILAVPDPNVCPFGGLDSEEFAPGRPDAGERLDYDQR